MENNPSTFYDEMISRFKNNKFIVIIIILFLIIGGLSKAWTDFSYLKQVFYSQPTENNILKTVSIGTNVEFVIDKLGKPNEIEKIDKKTTQMVWIREDIIINGMLEDKKLIEVEYLLPESSNSTFDFYTPSGFILPKGPEVNEDGTFIKTFKPIGILKWKDVLIDGCTFYVQFGSQGTPAFLKIKLPSYCARPYNQEEEYFILYSGSVESINSILNDKVDDVVIRYSKDRAFGIISGDEEDGWTTFSSLEETEKFIKKALEDFE